MKKKSKMAEIKSKDTNFDLMSVEDTSRKGEDNEEVLSPEM
jgi:hypothetical protein